MEQNFMIASEHTKELFYERCREKILGYIQMVKHIRYDQEYETAARKEF
jgi:hypothetical protein